MDFSNKKIAVLGLGIEGTDVVRFLLKNGVKNITIFDQKNISELGDKVSQLRVTSYELGVDYLKKGLTKFDLIFRSPAFKLSMPELVAAKKAGVEISSTTKLFFDLCQGKIIGVTGTKGKGTTATLIYQILKKAGKKVFLAGNIGEPMLAILPKISKDSWVVLELSSFQLQDMKKSPHIAVVLFITSEHLDYHASVKEYIQAKTNIVTHQTKADFAVLNADNPIAASFSALTPAKIYNFSRNKKTNGAYVKNGKIMLFRQVVGPTTNLRLLGTHNWDNVCAAATAAWVAEADIASIKKAVFDFKGLEHRLELVGKIKDISFYNDSFSTTPETTIAAIKSFSQPIILVAGGSEKGSDYTQLGKEIAHSSVKCLILTGEMAEKIKKTAQSAGFTGKIIFRPKTMKKIVQQAVAEASLGDVVLLSPACASFGMFKNYKDRGNQFKKYVQAAKSQSEKRL